MAEKKETAKINVGELGVGVTAVSHGGTLYTADDKGMIELPAEAVEHVKAQAASAQETYDRRNRTITPEQEAIIAADPDKGSTPAGAPGNPTTRDSTGIGVNEEEPTIGGGTTDSAPTKPAKPAKPSEG